MKHYSIIHRLFHYSIVTTILLSSSSCAVLDIISGPSNNQNVYPHSDSKVSKLFRAIANQETEVVRSLIQKKVAVNVRDTKRHETPLHWASSRSHSVEIVQLLLDGGANIHAKAKYSRFGETALHMAADADIARLLIERGLDVDVRNSIQYTPLHSAARRGAKEVIKVLLAYQAAIEARDSGQQTPLHHAAMKGDLDSVKLLLKHGADPYAEDRMSYTPLHTAAGWNSIGVVRLFLAHDVPVDIKGENNIAGTPLIVAAREGNRAIAELLVTYGADVYARDRDYTTALHKAAQGGHIATVQFLLEQGVPIDIEDKNGKVPLHYAAARYWDPAVMKFFLDRGVPVNIKDHEGRTPLHYAAQSNLEVTKFLVEQGADVHAKDIAGNTPRMLTEEFIRVMRNGGRLSDDVYDAVKYLRLCENNQ